MKTGTIIYFMITGPFFLCFFYLLIKDILFYEDTDVFIHECTSTIEPEYHI